MRRHLIVICWEIEDILSYHVCEALVILYLDEVETEIL